MENVKISMTIMLPGSVIMSRKDARKDIKNNYNYESIVVNSVEKGKMKKKTITIKTRKCYPIKQVINMTKEAYDYMTSNEVPEFSNIKEWKRLSKKQKLETHLNRVCADLNGMSYTYEVLDD